MRLLLLPSGIRHRAAWLAVGSLAFVALSAGGLHVCYMTNDNVGIADFASLGYPVQFTGALFTLTLHALYAAAPGLPWYPLSLYGLHVLALFLWLWLLDRVCRPGWLTALFALAVLGYTLRCLLFLDYTSTAVMLSAAALAWLGVEVLERRALGWRHLAAGIVFTLGMLVRPQVPLGVLAYSLPFGLWALLHCFRDQPAKTEARRLALVALLFLAPVAANAVFDDAWRQMTLSPQEASYNAFNSLRGHIHRLSRPRKGALIHNRAALKQLQWTPLDLAYLYNWYFLDERIYNVDSLSRLLQAAPPPDLSAASVEAMAKPRLSWRYPYLFLMLAPLVLVLPLLRRRPWPHALAAAAPVWCLAVTLFMLLEYGFLDRVEFPFEMGFGFLGLVLLNLALGREPAAPGRAHMAAGLCAAALLLFGVAGALYDTAWDYTKSAAMAEQVTAELDTLNRDYAGSTVLVQSREGFLEVLDPLHPTALRFNAIQLGWNTFSPRFYDEISRLGIQHGYELVDALIAHPGSYMLGVPGWPKVLLRYATDPGKRNIKVVTVASFPTGLRLSRYQEDQQAAKP